jgi:preprotein translocase subunit YajC
MGSLIPLLLLPIVFYFLLIRPQQKKMKQQQQLLSAIQEGDEVMTTAGMYGFVNAIDGDTVWLEIAEGVEIRMLKGAIAKRIPSATESPATTDGSGSADPLAAPPVDPVENRPDEPKG